MLLTGDNGTGKTTLLRILATLLRPTRGSAQVFNRDVSEDRAHLRGRIGLVTHENFLYNDLTAQENLLALSWLLPIDAPPHPRNP